MARWLALAAEGNGHRLSAAPSTTLPFFVPPLIILREAFLIQAWSFAAVAESRSFGFFCIN